MSESSVSVTDPSAFKKGSLAVQVVLAIVTLGLYALYWSYSTAKQLDQGTDASLIPILAFIPLLNIIVMWQISDAGEAVTDQGTIVLFALFVLFPPVAWYLVQSGINGIADGQ